MTLATRYTTGELFCGAGGLSRGFHNVGFNSLFANDIWDLALNTFLTNFSTGSVGEADSILALPGSVEDIDTGSLLDHLPGETGTLQRGDLDVLLGGPPCQGFSVNSHIRSAEDPRNFLFRHYVRILRGLAPKTFVLENVPGMLSLEGGAFLQELVSEISSSAEGPGYDVECRILNAAHYGVPQERFRIVVVGTRKDVSDAVGAATLPAPVHYSMAQAHFKGGRSHTFHYAIGHGRRRDNQDLPRVGLLPPTTVEAAIGDLPALTNGGGDDLSHYTSTTSALTTYQETARAHASVLANHWCRELVGPNIERVKHIPVGGDWRSIPRELLPPGMQRALRKDHTKRYGRLAPDEQASTLLTKPDPHWGKFIHYDVSQQRLISVREAARLQSFPDHHVFCGAQVDQYKLCGNAVPPLLAEAVAHQVSAVLDRFSATRASRTALANRRGH
jgi:DNA (cytosine-5)-methyltransferase 1